ncbi:V-type H(+)-translocating pyrophosphatase [Reticulomyxa filosa]|uniref:H(+)-exporting diphosphatase n=1 Tax=Reticulomyxa filosa TaxID=46433 RepID=X6MKB0_RETFI|nr:V-type H(+)-translocating pyrophosphatase [Reticulomyxa filosa]|eukprot:ETO14433.1 V-type H(+)-translocating pyrophosphatase [Reticulomyxa filosa]
MLWVSLYYLPFSHFYNLALELFELVLLHACNTTAATGKGFAIGSAVLTALALISAYKSESKITTIDISKSEVLASVLFGACLPYVFAALTMMAVGRAASLMIEEVRRQFRELDLLNPNTTNSPDTQRCVEISTYASVLEMIVPSCLLIFAPLFIGYLLGAEALGGMLIGAVSSAFMLAVFMANAGGALRLSYCFFSENLLYNECLWDNAKKFIEANGLVGHGKGSAAHKAAVVGDTIGDPFKDTSGPSLNILIKLNTMLSLVFGGSFKHGPFHRDRWWIAVIVAVIFFCIAGGLFGWMRKKGIGKIDFNAKSIPEKNASQLELNKPANSPSPQIEEDKSE